MATDNADQINTNAGKPKRAEHDGRVAEQHSIGDQIKANQHAAQQAATAKPHHGVRFSKFVPPGAI